MNQEMMFFYPCKKDPGRVSLDVNLAKPIDVNELFDKIIVMPQKFKYPQISEKLGLVKFDYGPRNIIIFKNGRMKIQNCKDQKDAKFALGEIEVLL